MKTKFGRLGIYCMAAAMLICLVLAALLPVRAVRAEESEANSANQPVLVDTHLNLHSGEIIFDTSVTEGSKKVSVSEIGTGTLTTVFGLGANLAIDGRVNANDTAEGQPTEVAVFTREEDEYSSLRMHYDWYGATLSEQKIIFDSPVEISTLKDGILLDIFLHTGAASPFQTIDGIYGMKIYSVDDTGAEDEGILIPNTTLQDEWTKIYIPAEQLALLADNGGMLSGLQFGSRFHWADSNAPTHPDLSKGASQGYIKFRGVEKVKDGPTLEKVYGETTVDKEPTRDIARPIEVVSDDTAQDNDSYFFRMNWYGVVTSTTTIVLDEPVNVEEISSLVVRLKVDADVDQDPYFTNPTNGIVLYPLGAVGEAGEGVQLQSSQIIQRQWVDYNIGYEQAVKLADSDGYIRGIQLGARFHWGQSWEINQAGDYSFGYSHDQTGGTDDNLTINIDTISYIPYVFDGYLTQGDGGVSESGTGTITEVNGFSGDDFDGLNHALNQGDIKVVSDPAAVDGYAFKINLFAWSAVRSLNYVEFRTPLSVDEADGLVVRLKLHISQSQPYASAQYGYGVYLFDKGATGAAEEQFTVPQDTLQEKYVNVYIGKNDLIRMAGLDGMLEGLQISSYLNNGIDTTTYNNGEPYIMIDYIAVSRNVEITFKDGEDVLKTDLAPTFFATTENYYIPQKDGKLFVGWKNGDTYFEFSALLTGDVTLTAEWVDQAEDLSEYYGLYKSADGKYITLTEDAVDISAVTDAYSYWGIGTDGKLYIVNGTEQYVVDLSGSGDYAQVETLTVTYNTKLERDPVMEVLVEKGTATYAPQIVRNGYELIDWLDEEGNSFDFETVLSEDISLTAVYQPIEIADASKYFGNYYDAATGTMAVLSENNEATFTADGVETKRSYYILMDNVIAFAEGDDFEEGTLLAARMMIGDSEYIRLTQYLVTFDTDGGTEIDQQTVSEATGYKATKPADPVKEDYTFKGWYLSDNTPFDFDAIVTESVTLYAHWDFAENEGEGSGDAETGGKEPNEPKGCGGMFAGASVIVAAVSVGAAAVLFKRKDRS